MRVGAATAGRGLLSVLLWFWPPGVFWGHNHVIGAPALGCQIVPKESSGRWGQYSVLLRFLSPFYS